MSLFSMTGQGVARGGGKGGDVVVEISSVNRKQLDWSIQLPRAYAVLEPRVQTRLSDRIHRGRIQVDIRLSEPAAGVGAVQVNRPLAKAYIQTLRAEASRLGLVDDLSLSHLFRLPDVVQVRRPEADAEQVWPQLEKVLMKALRLFLAMRKQEGLRMQEDLQGRLDKMKTLYGRMLDRAPSAASQYRKRLRERLTRDGFKDVLEDERVLKEIAIYAERSDVSEELARLCSHLEQVEACFRARGPVGRRLDFLAQEMLRETNTVGSKSGDLVLTRLVIDFKTELERFREQAQNIE